MHSNMNIETSNRRLRRYVLLLTICVTSIDPIITDSAQKLTPNITNEAVKILIHFNYQTKLKKNRDEYYESVAMAIDNFVRQPKCIDSKVAKHAHR